MAMLRNLGARSVPVVSKRDEFVFAQSLDDIAEFLGVEIDTRPKLSSEQLIEKYNLILKAAARHIRQIPDDQLGGKILDRDRTYRELTCHIFRIAEAFLDTANGTILTTSYYTNYS